jgi:tetratricopeptide (TPR) repeat protein
MERALGNLDAARRDWETSLGIAPTGTAYSNLGTLMFFDGRYAQAARYLEEAVKARPATTASGSTWAPRSTGRRASGTRRSRPYRRAVELAERGAS